MNYEFDEKNIKQLKEIYKKGTKIKLINMVGENIPSGTLGEVTMVDDIGQIHVNWNNGSNLAINTTIDTFEIIK